MAAARTLKLERGEPVNVALTCSAMCWRQVGKLIEYEIAARDWTLARTCREAIHPVSEKPMSNATLTQLISGEYSRGGPFIATLQRVFLGAFRDSGYELILRSQGAMLTRKGKK
jgi:hypothetical protein